MKRLCLMRHAKSSWQDSSLADIDRPLNKRGLSDAPMMGKRLAAKGLKADLIASSPANRALTTARTIALHIAYPEDNIRIIDEIYLADPAMLYELAGQIPDTIQTAMFFGHNPGFTYMANDLGDLRIDNMPTCSIAVFDLDIDAWSDISPHCGKLSFVDYPKNTS